MDQGSEKQNEFAKPSLIYPADFINGLVQRPPRKRFVAHMMALANDAVGQQLLLACKQMSPEIPKRIYVDAWSHMVDAEGNIRAIDRALDVIKKSPHSDEKRRADDAFFEAFNAIPNTQLVFINEPRNRVTEFFPFTGRDHIKGYILDDDFYIGGFQFTEGSVEAIDFLVKYSGPVADRLSTLLSLIEAPHRKFEKDLGDKDQSFTLSTTDSTDRLLLDVGNPRESLIMDTALKYIESAQKNITLMMQLPPDGRILEALQRAIKRDVEVVIITGTIKNDKTFGLTVSHVFELIQWLSFRKNKIPVIRLTEKLVHAKLLLVDENSDHARAMFGSHNLAESGVRAGTREWQMDTGNLQTVRQLKAFYKAVLTTNPAVNVGPRKKLLGE